MSESTEGWLLLQGWIVECSNMTGTAEPSLSMAPSHNSWTRCTGQAWRWQPSSAKHQAGSQGWRSNVKLGHRCTGPAQQGRAGVQHPTKAGIAGAEADSPGLDCNGAARPWIGLGEAQGRTGKAIRGHLCPQVPGSLDSVYMKQHCQLIGNQYTRGKLGWKCWTSMFILMVKIRQVVTNVINKLMALSNSSRSATACRRAISVTVTFYILEEINRFSFKELFSHILRLLTYTMIQ